MFPNTTCTPIQKNLPENNKLTSIAKKKNDTKNEKKLDATANNNVSADLKCSLLYQRIVQKDTSRQGEKNSC
jgi:hypothetical protein